MILRQQYAMVRVSREIMLNFIGETVGADLNTPVPAYGGKAVRDLLEHNAQCYLDWLVHFALRRPVGRLADEKIDSIPGAAESGSTEGQIYIIRGVYGQVDEAMSDFLDRFGGNLDLPITGAPDEGGPQRAVTPLQVFTHVVTHEFHHKGQILSM